MSVEESGVCIGENIPNMFKAGFILAVHSMCLCFGMRVDCENCDGSGMAIMAYDCGVPDIRVGNKG